MSKAIILIFAVLCMSALATNIDLKFSTPSLISLVVRDNELTFQDVFPKVDKHLRTNYWYYLRDAKIIYQTNADYKNEFMFSTIYRNIVGTFLVISTWDRITLKVEINTFVRLGDGFAEGSGALYSPVKIDPRVISLNLKKGEFMITIESDGTIKIVEKTPQPVFDIEKDMKEKQHIVDKDVREKYWYYLRDASLVQSTNVPTSKRYYYVSVYVNAIGTFLAISQWDRTTQKSQVATLVRLGNGIRTETKATIIKIEPIYLSPAFLEIRFRH